MQSNGDIFRRWKESVLGDGSMTDGGGGNANTPRTDCPTTDKHGVRGNLRIAFSTTLSMKFIKDSHAHIYEQVWHVLPSVTKSKSCFLGVGEGLFRCHTWNEFRQ